ncbi:MAG TPA: SGNH/GDSL hydrolase family protein [Cyclobacteriaceae bacterium]|nr:SGNH/GDSL hydrolase family protein [Cyclobacteriaceae bacterium]
MKKLLTFVFFLNSLLAFSQTEKPKDWANLKKFAMENQKLTPPAKGEKRVVFMGNSITQVWKDSDTTFFKNKLYINRGISGQVTEQMLLRFQQDVVDLKPAVVVILAGINDIAENNGPITVQQIHSNIVSMVKLARANKIRVVVSSVLPANNFPWRPAIKPADKVIELNSLLESYCKANKVVYCDYYSKMVNNEKGLDKTVAYDGVHPTLEGYKIMEPLVEEAIATALRQKK